MSSEGAMSPRANDSPLPPSLVPFRTRFAYGIGATAESSITMAFNSFNFLFYNNVLELDSLLCGIAVAIALLFDAISDPLVGSLSDRWRSRLGRRHPFLYAAPIPMALFFFCIYSPPSGLEEIPLFLWFTTFTILLRTAQTLYQVPHLALGAEMTSGYRERSVLMSYNTIFGLVGTFGVFFLGWSYFGDLEGGTANRRGYEVIAGTIAVFSIIVVYASAFFTRDQIPNLSTPPQDLPRFSLRQLVSEVSLCLQNANYRALVYGILLLSATLGLHETLSSHLNLFFWELPPDQIRYMVLGAPVGLIAASLITPRVHTRFNKRNALIAGILGMSFAVGTPILLRLFDLFPENGSPAVFPILCSFKAISYCMSAMMVISIASTLADVTDEHELQTGLRQEGVFFAARAFFGKLTTGLGHVLAGAGMKLIAFPTGVSPGEIPLDVVMQFGVVAGPLTIIPGLISIRFYLRYNIDEARHNEIRLALAGRQAQP
jgi:GPH family glycoside/pentoside/hexuronide:cation symporter